MILIRHTHTHARAHTQTHTQAVMLHDFDPSMHHDNQAPSDLGIVCLCC